MVERWWKGGGKVERWKGGGKVERWKGGKVVERWKGGKACVFGAHVHRKDVPSITCGFSTAPRSSVSRTRTFAPGSPLLRIQEKVSACCSHEFAVARLRLFQLFCVVSSLLIE